MQRDRSLDHVIEHRLRVQLIGHMQGANPELLVGAVAGDYRICARVGSGTMGHVYDAEDVKLGRRVALKVLHKQYQKEFAPRFLREGKTLALLSHPNIVQLADMGQLEDGSLFLATELVDGESLRALMDRGPLEATRALVIVRQILDALDAAHGLGVVHRDIKPENIMIARGEGDLDIVKVLDFGVAKLLQDTVAGLGEANLTTVGFSVFGSLLYIAPECVTGQKIDARLDLYSLGAVLYEMLTGRPPFDHEDPAALMRMQAFDPPPTLRDGAPSCTFHADLEALVARALQKQPDDRFANAAVMTAAVDAALQSLRPPVTTAPAVIATAPAVTARPLSSSSSEPTQSPPARARRKHKLVLAGVAATIVVAVAVVFAASSRDAPASPSELAVQAGNMAAGGNPQQAIDTIERELASSGTADGATYLVLGHARFAVGRQLPALAAYERALRQTPSLSSDAQLRTNLTKALETNDSLAIVLALDLLSALSPPATDAIAGYASKGKNADGRQRAVMIAERDGFAADVDRVESWTLDLQQASSCDQRKAAIAKLAAKPDRRALPALARVRAQKCVEREATDAIARIEAAK